MTSIYPAQEKNDAPPTYEQAVYYPHAPPIPSLLGFHSTSNTIQEPQTISGGTYSSYRMFPPPQGPFDGGGGYPTYAPVSVSQDPPLGTPMFITTQSQIYGTQTIRCTCPHCHQGILTRVERSTGLISWLICGGILLFGGWLGCCLIPFCLDSLKDIEHYCPRCAVLLGTQHRM